MSECGIEGICVKADSYNSLEEAIKDVGRTNNSASIMVIGISEPKSNLLESEK